MCLAGSKSYIEGYREPSDWQEFGDSTQTTKVSERFVHLTLVLRETLMSIYKGSLHNLTR